MSSPDRSNVYRREQDFHDELAVDLSPESLPPRPPDRLEDALLAGLEPLQGLRILDAGCGSGDLTIQLAERGASVTGLDISQGMVGLARARVERFCPNATADFVVAPFEETGLEPESFDAVVGKWVLHHADVRACALETRRLLRPGGRALFIENSALNPVLRFAREHVTGRFGIPRLGTVDEHPLTAEDYALLESLFADLKLHFPVFEFFRLFDRQVLRFRSDRASRLFLALDDALERRPRSRGYSFRVIIEATR
jgi:SAM-dependent methyltransferase